MSAGLSEGAGLRVSDAVVRRGDFSVSLTLTVGRGEIAALIGPNGSGKTTVLHAISGLIPLASGRVSLDGSALDDETVWLPPQRRGVGLVPQGGLLLGHLSVLENVAFGLRAQGEGRAMARREAAEWLERFGMMSLARRRAGRLSGGQSQAVSIVRALASRPRVLLLDEPFSALDVAARPRIRDLVHREIARLALPTVLVSHDAVEVESLATTTTPLARG